MKLLKIIKIIYYFKNFLIVIAFYRNKYPKGQKILIKPRWHKEFYISRFSDRWLLDKIYKGESVKTEGDSIIENGIYIPLNQTYVYKEIFIDECYKWCLDQIDENSVVLDIGAHIGLFSLYCQPCKQIYAYEPEIEYLQFATRNIKENTTLFNLAVGRKIENKTISLKDIFLKIDKCDLMKIDVDGDEYDILFATPAYTFKKIKSICMEYHPHSKKTGYDLKKLLESYGYTVRIEETKKGFGLLYANY